MTPQEETPLFPREWLERAPADLPPGVVEIVDRAGRRWRYPLCEYPDDPEEIEP